MEHSLLRKACRRTLSIALALSMLLSLFPVQVFAAEEEKKDYAGVSETADTERRETAFLSAEPVESSSEIPEGADAEMETDNVEAEQANPSETLPDELAFVLDAESGEAETEQNNNGEFTPVEKLRYTVNDETVTITGCGDDVINFNIPATINSLPVSSISNDAFRNKQNIKSVIIPEGVGIIGVSAFQNCKGLTEVTLPMTAMFDCTKYNAVGGLFPSSDSFPFYGCKNISVVRLTGFLPVRRRTPDSRHDKVRRDPLQL